MTFGISGAHWWKVSCSTSFESSHQWYLYLKWAKGWQSLYKDHALGENLILVHKMQFAPIFIVASVRLFNKFDDSNYFLANKTNFLHQNSCKKCLITSKVKKLFLKWATFFRMLSNHFKQQPLWILILQRCNKNTRCL